MAAERRAQVVFVNKDVDRVLPRPTAPRLVLCAQALRCQSLHSARSMRVVAIQRDTLDAARAYQCSVVLNFANSRQLGGGYLHGAGAQEEQICYRSNLPRSLHHVRYPWSDERDMVYSPDVVVYRENEKHGYEMCRRPFKIHVVSAAAQYAPPVKSLDNGRQAYALKCDALDMKERMRRVLQLIVQQSPDDTRRRVVLGAWGCGAFGGPTYHVALLWREALHEFRDYFDLVVMAVLGDNYEIFKTVFP